MMFPPVQGKLPLFNSTVLGHQAANVRKSPTKLNEPHESELHGIKEIEIGVNR